MCVDLDRVDDVVTMRTSFSFGSGLIPVSVDERRVGRCDESKKKNTIRYEAIERE